MDERRGGRQARTIRWAPVGTAAIAAVLACKPAAVATTTPPPAEQKEATPRRVDPELKALADRLDPGPERALSELMPAWLKSQVDASLTDDPKSQKALAEAREAIAAWDKVKTSDPQAMLHGALMFGRGLVLAERAVLAGSDDPELLAALANAYRQVLLLKMFRRNGLFGQLLNMAVELARTEAKAETLKVEEVLDALTDIVQRAPGLQRHMTARLMREHPDHPTVVETMLRASQTEAELENWPEALELRKLAVWRKGKGATGADFAALATLSYKGFQVAYGDKARKEAEARGPAEPGEDKAAAFKRQLAEVDATAEQVRGFLALVDSPGLDAQNECGHLLLKVGRMKDAYATFLAMQVGHPNDARWRTGMAVLKIHRDLDFFDAAEEIRGARKMTGHDRLYYEVALGTVPLAILGKVTKQMAEAPDEPMPELAGYFEEGLELVAGLRAYDPARAAVLELLFTTLRDAVPKFMAYKRAAGLAALRKVPARALALTKKFPESRDVWRMVFAWSRYIPDAAKARAHVTVPLPAALQQDPDLRLQQARALFDVAVLWEDRTLLAAAAEAAASLPAEVDVDAAAMTRATIDAVLGFQGDKPALQRAVDTFTAVATRRTGKDMALPINNVAMVVAHGAGPAEAMPFLVRAQQEDPSLAGIVYNMGALAFALQAQEGLPEMFAKVAQHGEVAGLRLHARAWLVALAEAGMGDVAVTRQEFAAALAKEQADESRGRLNFGRWGVLDHSEFNVSLGYSTIQGLMLVDEVVPRWWLIAPAPTMEALLAARPKKGAKAKP
ncbi:hypothetical protein [Nannocystis radixulma]|uniref:Tetratricopeptide repeat protein n=1 Tax=Nannocystis radixulma TaxID=2995305 RepID=A0ABT5B735_9BACT|nr:hypothetical protein [Nannocystis radixulma]MDC0669916.1 hypothetical protein [Nannocystis radixulma]